VVSRGARPRASTGPSRAAGRARRSTAMAVPWAAKLTLRTCSQVLIFVPRGCPLARGSRGDPLVADGIAERSNEASRSTGQLRTSEGSRLPASARRRQDTMATSCMVVPSATHGLRMFGRTRGLACTARSRDQGRFQSAARLLTRAATPGSMVLADRWTEERPSTARALGARRRPRPCCTRTSEVTPRGRASAT
jgi:hypothetical protein